MQNKLKKRITAMLKECTGAAMCDSGGAYGRHWEKNQARNFEAEAPFGIELDEYGFICSREVYHFLLESLEITEESETFDALFRRKYSKKEGRQWADVGDFLEYVERTFGAKGIYGEGKPYEFNTYNGEDMLSQTLQAGVFYIGDKGYIALQIHQGCDVRGGYTDARIFKITDEYFDTQSFYIYFTDGTYISTDDAGAHWYLDGSSPEAEITQEPGQPKEDPAKIRVNGQTKTINMPGYQGKEASV
jgi:hypothetical protein